ncbi:MAG: alpha/beta fold hydrolase [Candidatus Promineofilum sp.]|nr:alpha/beta fold hydrolase [Promineifilum sp.]MCW5864460.1 alpha/beta fold hydrolase [Anaerolineae bacterium]
MQRVFLLPLLLLLAACAGRELDAVAIVATATAAPATALPSPSSTPPAPTATTAPSPTATATATATVTPSPTPTPEHPLMIEVMRRQSYPGSELTIERTLEPGENYDRTIASYLSEGNRIYALLTVPWGAPPPTGWPVIIFNHGWIPPEEYVTELRYVEYVDYIARSGYIVFRSDYRGHGNSEGEAGMPYSSPGYTIDVLNGMAAVLTRADADANRVGMWGHSMGGYITLRAMVVSDRIRAGVIWGGVVGPYPDLFQRGAVLTPPASTPPASTPPVSTPGETPTVTGAPSPAAATPTPAFRRGRWWGDMAAIYGTPEENPAFWASISAPSFVAGISGPVQLHHAITDDTVPWAASQSLYDAMTAAGVPVELYLYDNDSHDIDNNFYTAMRRTVEFFDRYVKEGARD